MKSIMKAGENSCDKQIRNEPSSKLVRQAIDQTAIGSIILLWGALLMLKQVGMIDKGVSTWPFPMTVFGILLVVGGIYRLSRSRADAS
jgi:hypothetical protein